MVVVVVVVVVVGSGSGSGSGAGDGATLTFKYTPSLSPSINPKSKGSHPGAGVLDRTQLANAVQDPLLVSQLLACSEAFSVLCDPDTFDEALEMMRSSSSTGGGIREIDLNRFCDSYDAVLENIKVALGSTSNELANAAKDCFKQRITIIGNIRSAYELFRPTEQKMYTSITTKSPNTPSSSSATSATPATTTTTTTTSLQFTGNYVRGLRRGDLLKLVSCRLHKNDIVKKAPALNSLFKPQHFGWVFRTMSVLSFGDNNQSNRHIVTWDGFRDFCLSYQHRLAKQNRLPLHYVDDILRIEHVLIDGTQHLLFVEPHAMLFAMIPDLFSVLFVSLQAFGFVQRWTVRVQWFFQSTRLI